MPIRHHRLQTSHLDRQATHRRLRRQLTCPAAPEARAEAGAAAAAAATTAAQPAALPFFPDRRCVEEIALPPLAQCHHYINLTNGIEAVARLQQLGLPYRCGRRALPRQA